MTILVDDRAGSKELLPHLLPNAELCRLEFGDAMFPGNDASGDCLIGVEYKTLEDFIASIESARLQAHQLPGMLSLYQHNYLLLQFPGLVKSDPETGALVKRRGTAWVPVTHGRRQWTAASITKARMSLENQFGVHVYVVMSEFAAAEHIKCFYRWWSKKWDDHKLAKQVNTATVPQGSMLKPASNFVRAVSQIVEGIGQQKAEALELETGGSWQVMTQAPVEFFEGVEGFGKVLAKRIWEAMQK